METKNQSKGENNSLKNEPKAPRTSLLPDDVEAERLQRVLQTRTELEDVTRQDILREYGLEEN